jgi:hypothetical protein
MHIICLYFVFLGLVSATTGVDKVLAVVQASLTTEFHVNEGGFALFPEQDCGTSDSGSKTHYNY